jgi:citrate lyase subunit beta / citryl-CoA lyase
MFKNITLTLKSLLFVPADKNTMLNKINSLDANAFILDLEDSVSSDNKEVARKNISSILPSLKGKGKTIFIRINEADSAEVIEDLKMTFSPLVDGYIIPKFERLNQLKEIIKRIKEKEKNCNKEDTSLILMIESPKGVLALRELANKKDEEIGRRLLGIALGGEDYKESLTLSRKISKETLGPVRQEIIFFARSLGILAIDTVYPDFKDIDGLKSELDVIISIGFTSKLAIHPCQVPIINESFYPLKNDIDEVEKILKHEDKIKNQGAININGVMYDMPHLKWAEKLKKYINDLERNK